MKNKIYLTSFLLIVLALQKGYTQDDRWRYIGNTESSTVYIDTRTVSYIDPYNPKTGFEVWLKWYCLKECYESTNGKTVEYILTKSQFKCASRLLRYDDWTVYYSDGTNEKTAIGLNWESINPDSIGELIMEHICENYK